MVVREDVRMWWSHTSPIAASKERRSVAAPASESIESVSHIVIVERATWTFPSEQSGSHGYALDTSMGSERRTPAWRDENLASHWLHSNMRPTL